MKKVKHGNTKVQGRLEEGYRMGAGKTSGRVQCRIKNTAQTFATNNSQAQTSSG